MTYEKIIENKDAIIREKERENLSLKSELTQLKKLIFGRKSERFVSNQDELQINLFDQEKPAESEVEKEQITYQRDKKNKRNHPGRHKLPEHLPVEEIIIEPDFDTEEMTQMSSEVTETLKYTKASLVLVKTIRVRYKDEQTQKIHIAPLPNRSIPKCLAENSLLAHIAVSKMVDHLPLYRQAQIFSRDFQWHVSRGTLSHWLKSICTLLEPLYQSLIKKVLESKIIQADESPIKVLEKKEIKGKPPPDKKVMRGYMWVYRCTISGLVFFNYRKGRGMHGPKEILGDYAGYVQCDGYSVYDKMAKANPAIKLVGCHTHARRKFFEAQDSDLKRAKHALNIYGEIYAIEKSLKSQNANPGQVKEQRQKKTRPLLEELKKWVEDESLKVIPQSPMGKAMTYFQKQWKKLIAVLDDGNLPLDNNLIENQIRPLALGRKNYMFAGSHEGAYRLAMLYSFFGTCKAKNINPQEWLSNTLDVIADHSVNRLEELLPGYEK